MSRASAKKVARLTKRETALKTNLQKRKKFKDKIKKR